MEVVGRTVYYTRIRNKIVFNDWMVCHTQTGDFIEPLKIQAVKTDGSVIDLSDDTDILTNMVEIDFNKLGYLNPFGEDGILLHCGGTPKEGF